ncbi:hypothetical protein ACKWTF_006808 [Chironomus riparius]
MFLRIGLLTFIILVLFINYAENARSKLSTTKTTRRVNRSTSKTTIKPTKIIKTTSKPTKRVKHTRDKEFNSWAKHYNKSYDDYLKSESEAAQDFWTNYNEIKIHNLKSNESYLRNLQAHSDLTFDEKKEFRMGLKKELFNQKVVPLPNFPRNSRKSQVNYTDLFPPVKDQGYCGACWAFTSVSLLEYISRKNNGSDFYSEQCLIDCDMGDGGCEGGWPGNGLAYVRDYGISDGSTYVYKAYNDTCMKDEFPSIFTIDDVCTYDIDGDEEKLRQLVNIKPVIACIGTTDGFTSYSRGIFYDKLCPSNAVDHAVTIVGYGSDGKGKDYWIIRNSWVSLKLSQASSKY